MIGLEPFTSLYFKQLIAWIGSHELLYQFAGPKLQFPLTETQLQAVIDEPGSFAFAVKSENSELIGHAQIIKKENSFLIRRLLIGEKSKRNKGFGKDLVKELLRYGFTHFEFDTAELNVFDNNKAAIHCYEKVGFKLNPKPNYTNLVGNQYWTSLNMFMGKEDFYEIIQKTNFEPKH